MKQELIDKGYKYILNMLDLVIKKKRLSHAYIIEGEEGTPKLEVALYFAMKLYCSDACEECNNCKNILNMNHFNLTYITNDGANIKTDSINKTINDLSKKSMVDGPRIVIINNANRLTQSSANKLLKTIEEPYDEVYFLLLTSKSDEIISTILSRCQILHLNSIDKKLIKEELIQSGVDKRLACVLPYITNSINEANDLLMNESFEEIYKIVIELTKKLTKSVESILFIKNYYGILENRDNFSLFIRLLLIYLSDIVKYDSKIEDITFIEEMDNIKMLASSIKTIEKAFKLISNLEKKIDYNINFIMFFESILLEVE